MLVAMRKIQLPTDDSPLKEGRYCHTRAKNVLCQVLGKGIIIEIAHTQSEYLVPIGLVYILEIHDQSFRKSIICRIYHSRSSNIIKCRPLFAYFNSRFGRLPNCRSMIGAIFLNGCSSKTNVGTEIFSTADLKSTLE